MAQYNGLKSDLANAIQWDNGDNLITGPFMLSCLNTIINVIGANFQYAGIATPDTNPGTPDPNVFYLAAQAGTYTNFGGIVLGDGEVAALTWNGTWTKRVSGIGGVISMDLPVVAGQQFQYTIAYGNWKKGDTIYLSFTGRSLFSAYLNVYVRIGGVWTNVYRINEDSADAPLMMPGNVDAIRIARPAQYVTGTGTAKVVVKTHNSAFAKPDKANVDGFKVSRGGKIPYILEQGKTYCVRNTGTANGVGFYGYDAYFSGTGVALATGLYPGDIALFTPTQDYVQVDISNVAGAEVVIFPLDSCGGGLNFALKSIGAPFVIKQGGIYVPFHRNAGRDFIVRNTGTAGYYVYGYDASNNEYQLCYAYAGRISYFRTPTTIEQLYISAVAGASAEVYEVGTLLAGLVEHTREPIALRAVSFNAGDFSGIGIAPPSDDGALTYRNLLGKINGAIIGTQEDVEEYGGSEDVRQTIFPMFPYYVRTGTGNYNYKGFASDCLVTNVERIEYTGASFNHPWFLRGILHVGGREVLVVSFHFDWADKDRRALQIQQIIAYCADYKRVIMMGDTNPENTSEGTVIDPNNKYLYETEWAIFAAAGYKMANGGDFGYFGTCLDNGDWHPYDNVFVSGGTIAIKQADIITESWMNDHKPMIADIVIL